MAIVFDADKECRSFSAGVAVEEHVQDTIFQMLDSFHSIFDSWNKSQNHRLHLWTERRLVEDVNSSLPATS